MIKSTATPSRRGKNIAESIKNLEKAFDKLRQRELATRTLIRDHKKLLRGLEKSKNLNVNTLRNHQTRLDNLFTRQRSLRNRIKSQNDRLRNLLDTNDDISQRVDDLQDTVDTHSSVLTELDSRVISSSDQIRWVPGTVQPSSFEHVRKPGFDEGGSKNVPRVLQSDRHDPYEQARSRLLVAITESMMGGVDLKFLENSGIYSSMHAVEPVHRTDLRSVQPTDAAVRSVEIGAIPDPNISLQPCCLQDIPDPNISWDTYVGDTNQFYMAMAIDPYDQDDTVYRRSLTSDDVLDEWLRSRPDLNEFGDPLETVYTGGSPLFNEQTGKRTSLIQYLEKSHPDKPWGQIYTGSLDDLWHQPAESDGFLDGLLLEAMDQINKDDELKRSLNPYVATNTFPRIEALADIDVFEAKDVLVAKVMSKEASKVVLNDDARLVRLLFTYNFKNPPQDDDTLSSLPASVQQLLAVTFHRYHYPLGMCAEMTVLCSRSNSSTPSILSITSPHVNMAYENGVSRINLIEAADAEGEVTIPYVLPQYDISVDSAVIPYIHSTHRIVFDSMEGYMLQATPEYLKYAEFMKPDGYASMIDLSYVPPHKHGYVIDSSNSRGGTLTIHDCNGGLENEPIASGRLGEPIIIQELKPGCSRLLLYIRPGEEGHLPTDPVHLEQIIIRNR